MAYCNLVPRFKSLLATVADPFRQGGWMGEVQQGLLVLKHTSMVMKRSEQSLFVQPSLLACPPRLVVAF